MFNRKLLAKVSTIGAIVLFIGFVLTWIYLGFITAIASTGWAIALLVFLAVDVYREELYYKKHGLSFNE